MPCNFEESQGEIPEKVCINPVIDCFLFSFQLNLLTNLLTHLAFSLFINTSIPSDDKSTKPAGVQLMHMYLLFFSTK